MKLFYVQEMVMALKAKLGDLLRPLHSEYGTAYGTKCKIGEPSLPLKELVVPFCLTLQLAIFVGTFEVFKYGG